MTDIVALIMIFGVFPISLGSMIMYYKLKRMQLQGSKQLSKEEVEAIMALARDNKELRKRIENMELIMHEATLLASESQKS